MTQTLKSLTKGLPTIAVHGDMHIAIERIVTDSRRVVPGSLFIALQGLHTDGNLYIDEAVRRGASAIISDKPYARTFGSLTHIQVENARVALASVAARFYGHPDESLNLIGITGTNGKTTVASLAQFLLEVQQGEIGMLGTIHYDLGQRTLPAYRTTPESVDIHAMLREMYEGGCSSCVMEVSSHAIHQRRVQGLQFNTVVYLNLSQDHMDYHGSMEEYFACKRWLFTGEIGHQAPNVIVNLDDAHGGSILDAISSERRVISFGRCDWATIRAENVVLEQKGSRFDVIWPQGRGEVRTLLPGEYNVSNVLAALAIAYANGLDLEKLVPKVRAFPGVAGRMQRVDAGQEFEVLVDYAHTDDALRNVLETLRPITPGRLLVVFGCGGNRDRTKRPKMVRAVQDVADYAWVTADNPRNEPLAQIFEDMREGITCEDALSFVDARDEAIRTALAEARPGDCVLIAGKGHETFQEYDDRVIPFDDRQVALAYLMEQYSTQPPL